MLKLNSTGGKLDITITDESLFGTGKRAPLKQPHKGAMVTKASHFQGRRQAKPVTVNIPDKEPRAKDSKQSKPTKKELVIKQDKVKTKQQKKFRPQAVAKVEENKPHDAGVVTQTQLENILLLLKTEGVSAGKSLSPEQLSQLLTPLDKNNHAELTGNKENNLKLEDNSCLNEKRKESRDISETSKREENKQEYDKIQMNTTAQVDAEDKKLQWKRELDEQVSMKKKAKEEEKQKENKQIEEYNPWGRPGAGAPIRSQSGKVLADYHHRAVMEENKSPKNETFPVKESIPVSVVTSSSGSTIMSQSRPNPVATVATSTSDAKTTVPVALRSSFAIGAPGLVAHDTQQKRLQELQWKQELEKQIEEKKERERQRKLKEAQEDLLNLSWNAKHQRPSPPAQHHQQQQQQHRNDVSPPQQAPSISSRISDPYDKKPGQDTQPQGTQDSSSPLLNASLNGSLKTHARGFGMQLMDPQAKEDAEKKRLKMLEHQRAIQEQVEEKRRIKQREREQRLKEEAIEEARLAKEREMLNQAFVMEQKKKREKEEEAKRISEALQQSVLDAYQASQQAKADKRRRHLGPTGQDTRGATTSRSYVVSQGTSDTRHIAPDNVPGIPAAPHSYDNHSRSVLSNYESPRVTDRKRQRTNRSIGRTSQASTVKSYTSYPSYKEAEAVVPPLDLPRGDSPPVPTLRNKMTAKNDLVSPKSRRAASPAVAKGKLHRTVSSHSEPCDGSLVLSSNKRGAVVTQRDEPLTSFRNLTHDEESDWPFSTLEDAFMIPYHRTDSATLPAPSETPEPNAPQGGANASQGAKKSKEANSQKHLRNSPRNNGKTITPMYRTASSHLAAERTEPKVSPRRAKGNKTIQARYQSQVTKTTPSPRGVTKATRKESDKKPLRKTTNTQQRGKELVRRVTRDHVTPRNEVSSMLSTHQEIPEPLPTARQEMILQQLAALRQGLIIKERELKQDTMHL